MDANNCRSGSWTDERILAQTRSWMDENNVA